MWVCVRVRACICLHVCVTAYPVFFMSLAIEGVGGAEEAFGAEGAAVVAVVVVPRISSFFLGCTPPNSALRSRSIGCVVEQLDVMVIIKTLCAVL